MYVTLQSVSIIINRIVLTKHINADLEKTEYIPMNTVRFQLRMGSQAL